MKVKMSKLKQKSRLFNPFKTNKIYTREEYDGMLSDLVKRIKEIKNRQPLGMSVPAYNGDLFRKLKSQAQKKRQEAQKLAAKNKAKVFRAFMLLKEVDDTSTYYIDPLKEHDSLIDLPAYNLRAVCSTSINDPAPNCTINTCKMKCPCDDIYFTSCRVPTEDLTLKDPAK